MKITVDEWRQALDEEMSRDRTDVVPSGWITMREFEQRIGRKSTTASIQIRILLDAGKVETKTFTVSAGSRILPVRHYRLIAKNLHNRKQK